MKRIATLVCLALIASVSQTAPAATISGGLSDLVPYFSYYDLEDINGNNTVTPDTQTTDWVLYGANSGYTVGYTTKLQTGSFSTLAGATNQPLNGVLKFKHGAGTGTDAAATTGRDYGVGADLDATASAVSFTHTMLGQSETLVVYLAGLASAQDSYDLSVTMTGSTTTPYVLTDTALPRERVDTVGNRDGDYGILTLVITDAQPGDVLTLTFSTDYSQETTNLKTPLSYWGVGIGGASTTVTSAFIPEPATMALLGMGSLMMIRRRRA